MTHIKVMLFLHTKGILQFLRNLELLEYPKVSWQNLWINSKVNLQKY
jgi:hypothetical protein